MFSVHVHVFSLILEKNKQTGKMKKIENFGIEQIEWVYENIFKRLNKIFFLIKVKEISIPA